MLHKVDHQAKKTGPVTTTYYWWTLYLTFDAPVAVKQLLVSANRALPTYEVKECNPRFAIVEFRAMIYLTD
jgi:hypothetical protein